MGYWLWLIIANAIYAYLVVKIGLFCITPIKWVVHLAFTSTLVLNNLTPWLKYLNSTFGRAAANIFKYTALTGKKFL